MSEARMSAPLTKTRRQPETAHRHGRHRTTRQQPAIDSHAADAKRREMGDGLGLGREVENRQHAEKMGTARESTKDANGERRVRVAMRLVAIRCVARERACETLPTFVARRASNSSRRPHGQSGQSTE